MKIFVLVVAMICVVNVEAGLKDSGFEWSGNIKTLYDTANYTRDDLPLITNEIFKGMKMNCNGSIGMPNKTHIPSPTTGCDLEKLDELTEKLFKGYSEDPSIFLYDFWASDVGERFLIGMVQKGVSKSVVKAALKETWFTQSGDADYPFNRIFLEADRMNSSHYSGLNTWYTFEKDFQSRSECSITIYGEDLPVIVEGKCEEQSYRSKSQFVIPNHPYVDLVLFSICAWSIPDYSYASRNCPVIIPGSEEIYYILATTYMDKNKKGYLQSVHFSGA